MTEPRGLLGDVELVSPRKEFALDITGAIAEPATITRTIDGASTLTIIVADHQRRLITSTYTQERTWARFDRVHYEAVAVAKDGDFLTLTFEDAIATKLRAITKRLSIPAGSITRADFVARLAREAHVDFDVDPTPRGKVQRVLERSTGGEKTTSWDVAGEAAEEVHWRRFSTGRQLVVGSDEWLIARDPTPLTVREYTNGVQGIDWELDVGRRVSELALVADLAGWVTQPGGVVLVEDQGPADGRWIVGEITRTATTTRADIKLVRGRHALKEPAREGTGDGGRDGYVPTPDGESGSGAAGTKAREAMVRYALAQRGKPYVYGASGPDAFDCSGLVQEATRAGGRVLAKPSASQWSSVVAAGKTIPVAQALRTRGALLFEQTPEVHHVAISLGNDSTIEARGTADGVGVFGGAASISWTGAGLWL
ncbi:MAG: hypothetical protein F2667_00310 [Actinobacteria bacterium]|nr:hypothetical protein [Actinomycetota bacterium]